MKHKFVSSVLKSLYLHYYTELGCTFHSVGKLSGHINAKLRLASTVGYLLKTVLFSGRSMQTLANFNQAKLPDCCRFFAIKAS